MSMEITRVSQLSGKAHSIVIDLDEEDFFNRYKRWERGEYIQDAFDVLSPAEREFIKTGITDKEWQEMVGKEE